MRAPLGLRGAILSALGGAGEASKLGMPPLSSGPPAPERSTLLVGVNYITPMAVYTRATTASYVGSDGLIKTAAINAPRFEYDANGNYLGLLLEASRTNICLQSQTLDNASWTVANITVTADTQTAPDGTLTAEKLAATTTAAATFSQAGCIATGTKMIYSIFVHTTSSLATSSYLLRNVTTATSFTTGTFTHATGAVSGAGWVSQACGNGWYRLSFLQTTGITVSDSLTVFAGFTGNAQTAGDYIYAWGAQLEKTNNTTGVSSYIATTSASVTRAADSCKVSDARQLRPNLQAASFYLAGDFGNSNSADNPSGRYFIYFSNSANTERLTVSNVSGLIGGTCLAGSVTQASIAVGATIPANTPFTAAFAAAQDNFCVAKSGNLTGVDTSGSMPATYDYLNIGGFNGVVANLDGHIKDLRYYRHRLSDATLMALTS